MTVYLKDNEVIENVTKIIHVPTSVLGFSWLEIHKGEDARVISLEFLERVENT